MVKTWEIRKRFTTPILQFTEDGTLAAIMEQVGKVSFYNPDGFEPAGVYAEAGLNNFTLNPKHTGFFAVFVVKKSNIPNIIAMHKLNTETGEFTDRPISRSLFNDSSSVVFSWNSSCKTLLGLAKADKAGRSYYDANKGLYLLRITGSNMEADINHDEPIHAVSWCPKGSNLAVIYGTMPRTTTALFDADGNKLAVISNEARNTLRWSPCGRV